VLGLYPLHTAALSFDGPSADEPSRISNIPYIFLETRIIGMHFAADIISLPSLKFFMVASGSNY